jgi:hypothetical protein
MSFKFLVLSFLLPALSLCSTVVASHSRPNGLQPAGLVQINSIRQRFISPIFFNAQFILSVKNPPLGDRGFGPQI